MGAKPLFPPQTAEQAQEDLLKVVQQAPSRQGINRSRWWLEGLRQAVTWLQDCTPAAICRLLKRLGIVYKRGREYTHSPDNDYDLKLSYIQSAIALAQSHPQGYALLYQDELTYYRRPSLARAYAQQGSKNPRAVQGHTTNKKRRIAGALDIVSGQFFAQQRSSFNRKRLIAFYRDLEQAYPDVETLFLVQDNWPVHFHPDILLALQTSKICLLRLPTYAPWTNPVEKVWHRLKQQLLHQHPFQDDWLGLQQAVQHWLEHCDDDPHDLLHYVGFSPY